MCELRTLKKVVTMRNVEFYEFFCANQEKLLSVEFLEKFLTPFRRNYKTLMRREQQGTPKCLALLQNVNEFANMLVFMGKRKISSYLEIGSFRGGTLYAADSYLRAVNKEYKFTVAYDIVKDLVDYEEYHAKFPSCVFTEQDSQKLTDVPQVDFSFVDGHHTVPCATHDLNLVAKRTTYIGFHDACSKRTGIDAVWNEWKSRYESWDFIGTHGRPIGLGVLDLTKPTEKGA